MSHPYWYILYLFCFFSLISCHNKNKIEVEGLIKDWIGNEITFPNAAFTIKGKDTIFINPNECAFKILCYVDGSGCTDCKMKLQEWDRYIKETKKEYREKILFLFYFSPKNEKEIAYLLVKNDFSYPVCIDVRDSINIINKFPADFRFQTFLLDKDNKVVAIGNPILSSKVKKLFSIVWNQNISYK